LLDHIIVLNQRQLKRLMNEQMRYYHDDRVYLGLEKQTPADRSPAKTLAPSGRVTSMPGWAALHCRYDLAPDIRRHALMINLRKSDGTSVPDSCLRDRFRCP
jgi:hypothetical protein